MPDRRVELRSLRQTTQQSRLRQRQIAYMLAEVKLRSRFEPIRSMPQVDLVRIELEDLRLRKPPLNLHRQKDLLQLPRVGLLRREKEVSRQLHRQRRCALRLPVRVQVAIR